MKKTIFFIVVLALYSLNSFAQNDEMKKWMDYMTPGKEHKEFAMMDGDWTFTGKMWMDPNAEPQTYSGYAKFETLLGGRYSQMTITSKMMGMDYKGIGVNAYDNGKKVYISTWIDNFGTGVMYMEGNYDETSKTVVYKGKMYDPMADKDVECKETIKNIDDKTFEMAMYYIENGKELKNMEIKYTKK
ncbi:MAG: DUF1579 domain-containing protein [Ignavibacteria bacterium]|jgi:hypothetical protein